ncbi:M1 family metallopeptidase [Ginsengibacter hankyongi]|uniref:Aminopeptidase N n=1 Tax=Ginsengibacter hankyongi TaxID=2607284 RepID=A0A5J5IJW9_9BACT|nr:M1 family metallopeptidase [Ginsengibacter hankyongi]KAA9041375.1 M1 family metallopeptidase [Ginsengibacter hankyongi]
MKKFFIALVLTGFFGVAMAQDDEQPQDTAWKHIYRATATRINDLVHTKLDVSFDYDKAWMYGKEWVTLHPHFYATDSLTLDAKGMEIKEIALMKGNSKVPLKYSYDSLQLRVTLDKVYKKGENYTVYINYVSKPNELKEQGSAAITDAKGLYFINPKGEDKDKPIQIWTQGETESNSAWFPTIDKPNQKTTDEIYMTVPSKYVTLSNGVLKSQKKNADGTRTDYWKMDLPHAPYLFFMGVGDYVIVKDHYKKMPVDYYVEKEYAPFAKKIFGETPAMIGFYEKITGVPYAWPKYDQIVGRDYVSGAMENTTATLHQESAYQNGRQLVDGNIWEDVIAHELFHQWFGDLVTTESWSNITLNESFADYSETLWDTYRHGKDAGDEHIEENREAYLRNPADESKPLVRFYYKDKEDVFDQVSYPKGGAILHMLHIYVGDSAFFKSLNLYLNTYKFKSAEAQQLRLAFEEVTGQDLNWFWNEWYYGSGQPDLTINYDYSNKTARVIIEQTQTPGTIFKLPLAIDVYNGGANKKRYNVWVNDKIDTFYFPSDTKPSLINVDADKVLLAKKTDNKTADEFEQQYKYAGSYMDRKEALEYFADKKSSNLAIGLNDKYHGLRLFTLQKIDQAKGYTVPAVLNVIEQIADKDPDKLVQAKALDILVKLNDKKYEALFTKYVNDSSYSVSGAALDGLSKLEPEQAYTLAKKYSTDARGKLGSAVTKILMANATEDDFNTIFENYKNSPLSQSKIQETISFGNYLASVKNAENVRKGVDEIMSVRNQVPEQYRHFVDPGIKQTFNKISEAKRSEGNTQLADYIDGLLK